MQQLRAAPERVPHSLAVGNSDRGQFDQARRFDLVGQATDNVPDNFLNRDFPCIPQRSGNGFDGFPPFIVVALFKMISLVRKLIGQARGDVTDPTRLERRLTAAKASLISAAANGTNRHLRFRLGIVRRSIQLEEKGQVVGEDDHLTVSGFGDQALGDGLSVHVVERGNGIIEHDAGLVFGSGKFGHERGQRDATMLAFAQYLPHGSVRLPGECDLKTGNALNAVLLAKLDSKARDLETRHLARELRSQRVRNQCLCDLGTLRGDAIGRRVALGRLKRCDLPKALNLSKNVGFDAPEPLTIRQLSLFGE